MAQDKDSALSAETAGDLKGQALLEALKEDHWFWHWGNENWREDNDVPDGMVNPDLFMNMATGEIKTFLSELQHDGIDLEPDADPNQHPNHPSFFLDRVEFMEWLILRYLKVTPTYTGAEMEDYAAQKVAEAKGWWEVNAEDIEAEHNFELARVQRELDAVLDIDG